MLGTGGGSPAAGRGLRRWQPHRRGSERGWGDRLRRQAVSLLAALLVAALGSAVLSAEVQSHNAARQATLLDRAREQMTLAGLVNNSTLLSAVTLEDLARSRSWTLAPGNAADRAALVSFAKTSPLLSAGAALLSLSGQLLAASGPLPPASDPGYAPLRAALLAGRLGVSDALPMPGGGTTDVALGVPVLVAGAPVAVLLGYANIANWSLENYLRHLDMGARTLNVITDSRGVVIASNRRALLGRPLPPLTAGQTSLPSHGVVLLGGLVVARDQIGPGPWWNLSAQSQRTFFGSITTSAARELTISLIALLAALGGLGFALWRRQLVLRRLADAAIYDPLTGAATRRLVEVRLQAMQARCRRGNWAAAALFCDLDGFKQVNDALGHNAGDRLLSELARRFREVLRDEDQLSRLGGDEFGVLLDGPVSTLTPAAVAEIAERLVAAASEPVKLGSREVTIGASVGVAILGDGVSVTELLHEADQAMYVAKQRGGRRVCRAADLPTPPATRDPGGEGRDPKAVAPLGAAAGPRSNRPT